MSRRGFDSLAESEDVGIAMMAGASSNASRPILESESDAVLSSDSDSNRASAISFPIEFMF